MKTCSRCKQPLVDGQAAQDVGDRVVCTRFGCRFVEEINRRVDEGTFELVDSEQFRCEVRFPTEQATRAAFASPDAPSDA